AQVNSARLLNVKPLRKQACYKSCAEEQIRTATPLGRHPLKMVRLPISPLPHNQTTIICAQGGTRTLKSRAQRLLRPQRLPISPPGRGCKYSTCIWFKKFFLSSNSLNFVRNSFTKYYFFKDGKQIGDYTVNP